VFFTTINKFAPEAGKNGVPVLCERSNVVVIADEAHRTQYGFKADARVPRPARRKYGMAKYMRDALPNAIYLGMTGTPVSLDDRDTEGVFGTYVDVYDMIAAQEDEAVVPVSYESRIIELRFNEAEKQALMDEFLDVTEDEDETTQNKTVSRLTRLEAIAMADGRLESAGQADLVAHWEARKERWRQGHDGGHLARSVPCGCTTRSSSCARNGAARLSEHRPHQGRDDGNSADPRTFSHTALTPSSSRRSRSASRMRPTRWRS
jgi:type I site-specific restriction-modification system R (restriction) subunit